MGLTRARLLRAPTVCKSNSGAPANGAPTFP
jgi:hypothetical protein